MPTEKTEKTRGRPPTREKLVITPSIPNLSPTKLGIVLGAGLPILATSVYLYLRHPSVNNAIADMDYRTTSLEQRLDSLGSKGTEQRINTIQKEVRNAINLIRKHDARILGLEKSSHYLAKSASNTRRQVSVLASHLKDIRDDFQKTVFALSERFYKSKAYLMKVITNNAHKANSMLRQVRERIAPPRLRKTVVRHYKREIIRSRNAQQPPQRHTVDVRQH